MEPEDALPWSQEPAIDPCPEQDPSLWSCVTFRKKLLFTDWSTTPYRLSAFAYLTYS